LGQIAAERGLSSARLALLWTKDQPGVTAPIIGPRTLQHLLFALPPNTRLSGVAELGLASLIVLPLGGVIFTAFGYATRARKRRLVDAVEAMEAPEAVDTPADDYEVLTSAKVAPPGEVALAAARAIRAAHRARDVADDITQRSSDA
jgi:hypothetical protein